MSAVQYDLHIPQRHQATVAQLVPLARELARKAGPDGVTVCDLRLYAVQRGILTGRETGRQLSYLGAVLRQAGLEKTGGYRRSMIAASHGNLHAIHREPEHIGPIVRRVMQDIRGDR